MGWVTLPCGLWTARVDKMLFIMLPAFPWWNRDVPGETSEHPHPTPTLGVSEEVSRRAALEWYCAPCSVALFNRERVRSFFGLPAWL